MKFSMIRNSRDCETYSEGELHVAPLRTPMDAEEPRFICAETVETEILVGCLEECNTLMS